MTQVMKYKGFKINSIKDKESDRIIIDIEGDIGINYIDKVKTRIEKLSFDGDEIVFDLTKTETVDLSSIQLLYAIRKNLSGEGKSMNIISSDEIKVIYLLERTGFRELLTTRI